MNHTQSDKIQMSVMLLVNSPFPWHTALVTVISGIKTKHFDKTFGKYFIFRITHTHCTFSFMLPLKEKLVISKNNAAKMKTLLPLTYTTG